MLPWSGLALQRDSNTLEQGFVLEWLRQKLHCTCSQCLEPHFFVAMRCNEDSWNSAILGVQLGLQFQTGDPWHPDVRDETSNLVLLAGAQEFLRGGKCVCR